MLIDIDAKEWAKEVFAGSGVCDLPIEEGATSIKREHCRQLSVKRFIKEYERDYVPVVIDGIPEEENWGAVQNWTFKVPHVADSMDG